MSKPLYETLPAPILKCTELIHTMNDDPKSKTELIALIREHKISKLAEKYPQLNLNVKELSNANEERELKLQTDLKDKEQNFGATEVFECLMIIAHHFALIGDKQKAVAAYQVAYEKAVGVGARMEIILTLVRVGFFHGDNDLIERNLLRAHDVMKEGGDWDKRNKLKVYEGLFRIMSRDFEGAVQLLLDGLSTFTCTELFSYQQYVFYVVLCATMCLPRKELKLKVLTNSEVLECIHLIPSLKEFVSSLYNCQYSEFFRAMSVVEGHIKRDVYLSEHCRWYVKEMRILAYAQLLDSYSSVSLKQLSQLFKVSIEYLDKDLSRFIAEGRLSCVIDKVNGVVVTKKVDAQNALYVSVIKQGDLLLNRVQKLSKVINM